MNKEEMDDTLLELLAAGLITVEYTEDLQAVFKMTNEGKAFVKPHLEILKKFNV